MRIEDEDDDDVDVDMILSCTKALTIHCALVVNREAVRT